MFGKAERRKGAIFEEVEWGKEDYRESVNGRETDASKQNGGRNMTK